MDGDIVDEDVVKAAKENARIYEARQWWRMMA